MPSLQLVTAPHIFSYGTPFGILAAFEEENHRSVGEAHLLIADLPNRQIREAKSLRFASAPVAQANELPALELTPLNAASEWLKGAIGEARFNTYQQLRHFPRLESSTLKRADPTILHHLWLTGAASDVFPRLRERSRSPELRELLQRIMARSPYEVGEDNIVD